MLGRAPGAKVTNYPIGTQSRSQIDMADLDNADFKGVALSMDAGIPRTGDKDF